MQPQHLKIAALGDIMLDREVGKHFVEKPEDFDFIEIGKILSQYDIVLANLENPVGIGGKAHPKQDPNVAFCSHPRTLEVLKKLNVNIVTLANNHLLDYGEQSLKDTLTHLDDVNILHIGGGRNYDEANKPAFFNIRGQKIALLASVMIYSASTEKATTSQAGVADYSTKKLISNIKKLRKQGYLVLVTIHWGVEYCFYPLPYQRNQAKKMIDAGASLIIGHGPHFPQGIEPYKNGEIIHSLGNFIFDEPYRYAKRSFIYGASLSKDAKIIEREIFPVTLNNHYPILDPKGEESKTGILVNNMHTMYQRKNKLFWQRINNRWFSNIAWRVSTMGSWKFIWLQPLSFYFSLSPSGLLKKFNLQNIKWTLNVIMNRLFRKTNRSTKLKDTK